MAPRQGGIVHPYLVSGFAADGDFSPAQEEYGAPGWACNGNDAGLHRCPPARFYTIKIREVHTGLTERLEKLTLRLVKNSLLKDEFLHHGFEANPNSS